MLQREKDLSTEKQQTIHAAAAALRETAVTLDGFAKAMAEEPDQSRYPVVIPSPQGHHLSIYEDGSIRLTRPDVAPGDEGGWYFFDPSGLWDTLESMTERSQAEDEDDPEADDLLKRFRLFLHRRPAPQTPAGESAEAGLVSKESMIRADGRDPDDAVRQGEDHPDPQEPRYRDGLPVDADGRFILVEDPEELDLAESIAEHVAQEQLRGGLANADLGMIERYRNQVKKLKGELPADPAGGEVPQAGAAKS